MALSALMPLFGVWEHRVLGKAGMRLPSRQAENQLGSGSSPFLATSGLWLRASPLSSAQALDLASLALLSAWSSPPGLRQPATKVAQNSASLLVWEKNWQLGS